MKKKRGLPDISARPEVRRIVRMALDEDIGTGDVTTLALIPKNARSSAVIVSRGDCVVSGTDVAKLVFRAVDKRIQCRIGTRDGIRAKRRQIIMIISGPTRGILTAERTAINFLQRMSGIAGMTRKFVDKLGKRKTVILDTRKTTPGLRSIEKYAVLCGGGVNHRMGLYDMVLVKDNHRCFWGGRLSSAVQEAGRRYPGRPIEVEVETISELEDVLRAKPDWVLLDNMTPREMKRCVAACMGRARLEASGGVNLKNVASVAAAGVDAISVGALTHSAAAADFSLEIC